MPIIAAIAGLSLCSCAPRAGAGLSAREYFPCRPGTRFEYSSTAEGAAQSVFVDFANADGTVWQRHIDTDKQSVVEAFAYRGGAVVMTISEAFMTPLYDDSARAGGQETIVLPERIYAGATWAAGVSSVYINEEPGSEKETVEIAAEVTAAGLSMSVPYGEFTGVIEVTSSFGASGMSQKDYYAPGVGLIKTVIHAQRYKTRDNKLAEISYADITNELLSVTEDEPYSFVAPAFYPSPGPREDAYDTVGLLRATNDSPESALRAVFDGFADPVMKAALSGVSVNTVYVFGPLDKIKIDLGGAIYENAAGMTPETEEAVLQSIVNTAAVLFKQSQVCVTADGGPYVSANIAHSQNQYMSLWFAEPEDTDE